MKILKILLAGIGLILVVTVLAVVVFLATFDANQYKQDLAQTIQQQTGRELVFEGDIGLTFYPALGMDLGSMRFANAPGFGDQPMLAVQAASVSVDLLSLISLSPQIDQLVLEGLNINLQKNEQGKTNWDDLVVEEKAAVDGKPVQDETVDKSPRDLSTVAGSFGGFNISGANWLWKDASAGVEYQVQDLNLTSGRMAPGEVFPIQLNLNVQSPGQLDSKVALTAQVLLDLPRIQMNSLQLQTSANGAMIPVDNLQLDLSGDLEFNLNTQKLAINGFSTQVQSQGGVLLKSESNFSGEVGFDIEAQQLTVGALDLQAHLTDPALPAGKLSTGISAGQMSLSLPQNAIDLQELQWTLNENRFSGFVKVSDYTIPAVDFALTTPNFNVDSLLGETTGPQPVVSETPIPAEDIQISLPMDLLRSLKLNGQLEVGTLVAQKLTFNEVLLKVTADSGIIDLKPLKMNLYDGQFNGAVQVNAQGQVPVYQVNKKLSSFQIGQFLQDYMNDDLVSGNANVDVNLTASGEWLSELKSSLNGSMQVQVLDGALKGFNLRHEVDKAKAKFKGQTVPQQEARKTDFSALNLSGVIKDGVFSSDDLKVEAPLIRVGGQGSANLAEETVNYLVNAKLVGTTKGQQGGEADELSGLEIPVAITGPWLAPKIDVQLDEMMKARLDAEKARIRDEVAKKKAAVEKQLATEKAKLKAAQEKEAAAKKAQLQKKKELAEAKHKAELEARKKAEKEKAEKKLEEKLKKLF